MNVCIIFLEYNWFNDQQMKYWLKKTNKIENYIMISLNIKKKKM